MNRYIKLLPRFVRISIFGLIEDHLNSIDMDDVEHLRETILARLAAIFLL